MAVAVVVEGGVDMGVLHVAAVQLVSAVDLLVVPAVDLLVVPPVDLLVVPPGLEGRAPSSSPTSQPRGHGWKALLSATVCLLYLCPTRWLCGRTTPNRVCSCPCLLLPWGATLMVCPPSELPWVGRTSTC